MEEKIFAFWLCNLQGIGNRKIGRLLEYFGSPEAVFLEKTPSLHRYRT